MLMMTNEGSRRALGVGLGLYAPENIELRLFSNPKVFSFDDTAADYIQVAALGYAAQIIEPADWVASIKDSITSYKSAFKQFYFDEPFAPVYGLYGVGVDSGALYFVERWSNSTNFKSTESISVSPVLTVGKKGKPLNPEEG